MLFSLYIICKGTVFFVILHPILGIYNNFNAIISMKKLILSTLVLALIAITSQAKVKLPHLIGDNMILQQQTNARLWGWAKPGGGAHP